MNRDTAELIAKELQLLRAPRTDVMFHGLSMEPLLAEGDRVIVEPVTIREIRIGDIITYRFEDKFPTRRVAEVKLDYLILCCDNWPGVYFHAPFTDVLGRVMARTRGEDSLSSSHPQWQKRSRDAIHRYRSENPNSIRNRIRNRLFPSRRSDR